nr:polysaccharide biosynthesis tyrosine autokinase [Chitinispirillaceae bacterium]
SRQIIRENLNDKSVQFIQSRRFIESQLTLYLDKLNLLEDRIREFKETKKITNLNASTQAKISQISGIETRKSQLEIEEAILKNLSRYLVNSPRAIAGGADTSFHFAPALLSSPVLQGLYSTMLQSEAELRGRLKSYSPGHPKILEIQSTLTGLKDQLREEAAKRLITIRSEIGSVGSEITSLQGKLESVPADEIQLARLERDRETAEKLYTFFSEKLEETRVQEAGITSDLKLINPPAVSNTPVNPRGRMTSLILSLIFSILISIGAIFGVEYFDNTVKHLDLLKRKIDLPIFATIPEFNQQKHDKGKRSISWARKKRPAPVDKKSIIDDLSSPEFEAFRKLAINLTFAHPEKKYRVLYITSPGPEDGKTFLTLNLGTVLSVTGKKVLVIDTDFRKRKGHLSDVTEHKKEIGIFEVLEGKNRLKDVIVNIPERKLDLIPIGSVPPNPFIFLESERMKLILDTLKADYDHILIDGLPVLLFADATYLAAAADGALLSCRYGKTNLRALEESHEILKTSKTDVVGLILNYVPISRGSYYYSYYYKHYNKYYKKA